MSKLLLLLTAALGPDIGWQPLPDGGFEYVIQFDGQMLEVLRSGQDFTSDIPPDLRGVRRYRITVGSGEVPRIGTPPPPLNPDGVTSPLPPPESATESPEEHLPERTASWLEEDSPATETKETEADLDERAAAPDRPWLEAFLMIGLLASTSATVYLGWTTWVYRERYVKLLRQSAETQAKPMLGDNPGG